MTLRELIARTDLAGIAGDVSLQRGGDYVAAGRVGELLGTPADVSAVVRGRDGYAVRLRVEEGQLRHSCTCPAAADGSCCKHVVAVALALTGGGQAIVPQASDGPTALRDGLLALEKEELVELLVARAEWDDTLRRQLSLRVAAGTPRTPPSTAALREAIEAAVVPHDFVEWRGASDYDQRLTAAVQTVEGVLRCGRAREAVELAEHALACLDRASQLVDDSGGHLAPAQERLAAVHLAAAVVARPEPAALARWLYERERDSVLDGFLGAVRRYAPVLGPEGLAAYRHLAQQAWAKVRPLRPGDDDRERWGTRRRLEDMMLALADIDGDLEARLSVMAQDLSTPYCFLRIAQACDAHGDGARAVSWAEKGLAAFPGTTDRRLVEYLAKAYVEADRPDDAAAVAWRLYAEDPRPDAFLILKAVARTAGAWPRWRKQALEHARAEVERERKQSGAERGLRRADRSLLVDLLLADGDAETAWREAVEGGCTATLWRVLADHREGEHPDDAIPIFLRELESTLRTADDRAYREAVALLKRIQAAMVRADRANEFAPLLARVRTAHARRRNLLRLIDRERWET